MLPHPAVVLLRTGRDTPVPDARETERYFRQIPIEEFGGPAQEKLKAARGGA